ncbi:MAG: NAD(P)H:quinone oxidoreductase [Aestuariibacter sp.]
MTNTSILVLFHSQHGSTRKLAQQIALGAESVGAQAVLRCPPPLSGQDSANQDVPVTKQELQNCDGLALGSATRFGQMAVELKQFMETTSDIWLRGDLVDKPACVFTSSSSMHGGQESTLLSMALPLIHHGMLLLGIPYSEPELHSTQSGGTPYGASHVAKDFSNKLSDEEKKLAFALGKRLAVSARKLKQGT